MVTEQPAGLQIEQRHVRTAGCSRAQRNGVTLDARASLGAIFLPRARRSGTWAKVAEPSRHGNGYSSSFPPATCINAEPTRTDSAGQYDTARRLTDGRTRPWRRRIAHPSDDAQAFHVVPRRWAVEIRPAQ